MLPSEAKFWGMRIAWVGYTSLRRDQLRPTGSTDKYYGSVELIRELTGQPVHWLPLKQLTPDCHRPGPDADADEISAHAAVVHYGDALHPLLKHVQHKSASNRWAQLEADPFDWSSLKYRVPEVDVVLVESTCQIGAAYNLTLLLRQLWRVNPRVGFVVLDQDNAGSTTRSKMKKWHPTRDEQIVVATYHPQRQYPGQVMAVIPHLGGRTREPLLRAEPDFAYVGNDYDRREQMLKYLKGPRFHHYGRLKRDFEPVLAENGCVLHGSFRPTAQCSIEDLYRSHGLGINFLRSLYYKQQLITPRISEIVRAGVACFTDAPLQIARPLLSDAAMVSSPQEALARADQLPQHAQYWEGLIRYQQAQVSRYLSVERYVLAVLHAGKRLTLGPIHSGQTWHWNPYDDLLRAAGLRPWSA